MKETIYKQIFDILTTDYEYHSSSKISEELNVSYKTVQTSIKELNKIMGNKGAFIESKRGAGYLFKIEDKDKLTDFLKNDRVKYSFKRDDFNDPDERIKFILKNLLLSTNYVKSDDLAKQLLISKSQYQNDLKKVKAILGKYDLKISSKPYYGIKLEGSEKNKRICIKNEFFKDIDFTNFNNDELLDIKKIVKEVLERYKYKITDINFDNLALHFYIAMMRIKNGKNIIVPGKDLLTLKDNYDYKIATDISKKISKNYKLTFSNDEIAYITMHLLSKRQVDPNAQNSISKNVDILASQMIKKVKDVMGLDLTDDLNLRISLGLHLMPLVSRLEYGFNLKNPIIKDIKKQYRAFEAATLAAQVINEKYQVKVSEDEIAYIALHFAVSIDKKQLKKRKKKVLIVCGTGRSTAEIMKIRFQSEFGPYISSVETTSSIGLEDYDLNSYDLIITSIPLKQDTDTPIIEVGTFLSGNDIKNIKPTIKSENSLKLDKFFDRNLFLTGVSVENKDKAIELLARRIEAVRKDVTGFEDIKAKIYKREELAPTEFDNLVAVPHPYLPVSDKTFLAVMILKRPIDRDKKKVQLVVMMCLGRKQEQLDFLYSRLGEVLTDKEKIDKIIATSNFDQFLEILEGRND